MLPDSTDTLEDEDIGERMVNNENGPYSPGLENLEAEAGKFSLYPNPSSGNFIVESRGMARLAIIRLDGKLVAEYELKDGGNDVSLPKGLAPGVYIARYKPDGRPPVSKKLIYQP